MKELYTLSPELLTQRPRVQVGGQIFEVDDRTATVRQMMEITRQQLPSDQQMDQVLRLALGKKILQSWRPWSCLLRPICGCLSW